MKALKSLERLAPLLCAMSAIAGVFVIIVAASRYDSNMLICGNILFTLALSGRAMFCTFDIYDHLRGIPLPHERELVQAVASLRACDDVSISPLDRHYRRAAAEQEVVAAAEALVKARGWS